MAGGEKDVKRKTVLISAITALSITWELMRGYCIWSQKPPPGRHIQNLLTPKVKKVSYYN